MAKEYAHYEPYAWWLTKERIGQDLRNRYGAAPRELPPRMLALVRKLDTLENDRFEHLAKKSSPSLLKKFDSIEGRHLLRACRKHLATD
jgi:hypothetical protein